MSPDLNPDHNESRVHSNHNSNRNHTLKSISISRCMSSPIGQVPISSQSIA